MARPRTFEENEVLERALTVFWNRGYDGTSIEELVQQTGVGRASLYGAFGDKEHLFQRVVEHYVSKLDDGALVADTPRSARNLLEVLMARRVSMLCPQTGPRGCFLLLSGTSGGSAELTREMLARAMVQTRELMEAILRRAQREGALGLHEDVGVLAQFLVVVLQGIAASARAGVSTQELSSVAQLAVERVLGPGSPPSVLP